MLPSGKVKVKAGLSAKDAPKFCALTFDDGPNGNYMPQVQRILDDQGVKATFFLIGKLVPSNAKQLKALAASGHELANHSYSHPQMQRLSEAQQRQQIAKCQAAIEKLGLSAAWFRPPYGMYNRSTVHAATSQGLETVLWSVDPRDWAKPGVERIRNRVLRGAGNGAVILMHCTNAQTVAALPGIIKHLREQGYHFLTLSEWRVAATTGALPKPKPAAAKTVAATPPAAPAASDQPVAADSVAPATADPALLAGDTVLEGEGAETLVLDEGESAPAPIAEAGAQPGAGPVLKAAPPLELKPAASPLRAGAGADDWPVWANFSDPESAWSIWQSQRGGKLHRCISLAQPRQGIGPSGEVVDTALTPGVAVPALPEGEELVIPPADEATPPAETGQQAPTAAGATPAPGDVVLPPLEQRKPLDFRIVDLVDFHNPLTQWQPPATLDTAAFAADIAPHAVGEPYPGAQFYFLSLAPDIEDYTWVELAATVRLGKLSGLVLANEFVARGPQCELDYPWNMYCYAALDRGSMIDLTVENAADVMDVIAKGKPQVFIVVRPENLNFFISSHTLSEMGRNLRDFILLRQATAGLPYDPAPALTEYWKLPPAVHIGRFTDGRRVTLVLYTHDNLPHSVQVPPEFAYFSRVTVDAGGWLRVARMDETTVAVDATPVVLYYEYPQQ
jgi:peptidoglycan-N-acetylglucosamine deacetylase